jgi:hypothetical protein
MRRLAPLAVLPLSILLVAAYMPGSDPSTGHIEVDGVAGSDAFCSRGGLRCKTVERALAIAVSGDTVRVHDGTFTLAATTGTGMTVPAGVVVKGESQQNTVIQMLPTGTSVLAKFGGAGAEIADITLSMSTSGAHTMTGVEFDSTRSADSVLRRVRVNVTSGSAGAPVVYGIHQSGTGAPDGVFYAINNVTVRVSGSGTGTYRGIINNAAGTLRAKITNIRVFGIAAGDYRGIETANASAKVEMQSGGVEGTSTTGTTFSDVLQTSGTIELAAGAYMENKMAGGKSFTALPLRVPLVLADDGSISDGTRYYRPGTISASTTPIPISVPVAATAFRLAVNAGTAPGAGETHTVTVLRCPSPCAAPRVAGSYSATALTATLSGTSLSASSSNVSGDFSAGDVLAVEYVESAGASTADVVVQVSLY